MIRETADCRACPLGSSGLPRCVGFGPADAEVAVVGINPHSAAVDGVLGAFHVPLLARTSPDLRAGLRLRGAARAFRELARLSGLELTLVYSTNAVKCATPGNRCPEPREVRTCAEMHLTSELASLGNLRKVLILGRLAGSSLGLRSFGQMVPVDGTLAEAVLLRHPVATLRRWTALGAEAARWRAALSGRAPRY